MSSKISIGVIIVAHFESLRDFSTGKKSWSDYCVFVGLPSLLLFLALYIHYDMTDEARNAFINASAIFLGLLLNLLVLMFDQKNKNAVRISEQESNSDKDEPLIKRLQMFDVVINQTVANISFTTLLAIITLCSLLAHSVLFDRSGEVIDSITMFLSSIVLATWLCIILTTLMVIKRVFNLFRS